MKRIAFVMAALLIGYGCATGPVQKKGSSEPVFFPRIPEEPRLQFLQNILSEYDIGAQKKTTMDDFLLGRKQSFEKMGRIWDIHSVRGKIYAVDRDSRSLRIVNLTDKTFKQLKGSRLGRLDNPVGIWVTEDDIKYVVDAGRRQVVVFDRNNEFLRTYGDKELFLKPLDVAVFGNFVYVVDMEKHQVLALDKDSGQLVKAIGQGGVEEGQFYKPTHVIVDQAGNLIVDDAFNFRVQKFDPDGKFVKAFGSLGDNLGSFARPKGVGVDLEGRIYAADSAFANVQIFDGDTGDLLLFFGGRGGGPGSMELPSGVHIDYRNVDFFQPMADKDFRLKYMVYVSNQLGLLGINVYGFGEWVGPPLTGADSTGNKPASENTKPQ